MAAVTQNGFTLQFASEDFREDKEVVMAAVAQDGGALGWVSDELKEDKQFMQNIINNLHTNINTVINENKQLRTQLTNHESISVINVDTDQEEIIPRPSSSSSSSSSSSNNNKRKHTSIEQVVHH